MEYGRVRRSRRCEDLDAVEGDLFGIKTAQDLAALAGRPEGPEDIEGHINGSGRGLAWRKEPRQPPGSGRGYADPLFGPEQPGPLEAEDRVARDQDKALAGGGPDEIGFEPAQPDVRRAKKPGPGS